VADPKKPAPAAAPPIDIQALIAQAQAGGGAGTTDFLGLPANTASPTSILAADQAAQEKWKQGDVAPAYASGAQNLPVLQNWTPGDIATIQTRLIKAGLLDQDFRSGVWDKPSQEAFGQVLGLANNMGHPWQDALATYESATPMQWDAKTGTFVKGTAGTARTRAPVVTRFTSPDDLATTAQEVATAKLGRSFSPEELQKFISAYHGTEAAASSAQGAAAVGGGGGYTAPSDPTVAVAAATFAKQTDPTAYNAEQFLPLVQKMTDLLAGPSLATTKPMSA
jgi:hypothetical protein